MVSKIIGNCTRTRPKQTICSDCVPHDVVVNRGVGVKERERDQKGGELNSKDPLSTGRTKTPGCLLLYRQNIQVNGENKNIIHVDQYYTYIYNNK